MSESAAAQGYDLVLKGGRVLDERNGVDGVLDVAIKAGRIAAVGKSLAAGAGRVEDVSGAIVAPGLIDIHTHVYHKATSLSVDPGFIARRSATTTLVDAGSAGAGNYDGFRDYVMAQLALPDTGVPQHLVPGHLRLRQGRVDRRGDAARNAAGRPLRRQDRGQSRPYRRRQGADRRAGDRRTGPGGAGAGAGGRRTRWACR